MKRPPSIIQNEKVCYFTGNTYGLEPHEPLNKSERNKSIEDGLYIWVTHEMHRWLHDTEQGKFQDYELKGVMQRAWMELNYPHNDEIAIEMFKKRYFKNYL